MNGIDAINDLTIGDLRAGKVTVYGDIYDQKNGERNISQIITNLQSGTLVVSVKETEIKYGRNNSPTVAPETGWFDNPPAATEGEYLWTRTKWIYSNGTSKSSYSVVKDGKSSYLHTAWANSSDGTVDFSKTSSVGRSYIGTYSDSNEAGSSTPSKYKWVKTTGTAVVGVASKNLWEPARLITNVTNRGLRFQIDNPVRIHSLKVYSTESGYIDLVIKKSNGTAVFNSSYQVNKGEQTLTLELQLTDVGEYTITKTDSLSLSYHTTMESEFPFNSGTFKITASTGDSYTKTRYYYFYDWVVSGEGVIAKTPDLWFIGADGYWYLNGVKTAKPSQGTDGAAGANGTDGKDGIDGTDGKDGADGQSVSKVTTQYYLSTSKTSVTGGSWGTALPAWKKNTYIWTRLKIDYVNPTKTEYTEAVLDTVNNALNDIYDSGIILPSQKPQLLIKLAEIVEEYKVLNTEENKKLDEWSAYQSAYNSLSSTLSVLTNDMSATSELDPTNFKTLNETYVIAYSNLSQAIDIRIAQDLDKLESRVHEAEQKIGDKSIESRVADIKTYVSGKIDTSVSKVMQNAKEIKETLETSIAGLNGEIQKVQNYFSFKTDSSNNGYLELGSSEDALKLRQWRNRISFMNGEIEEAYFSNQALHVDAVVTGRYEFKTPSKTKFEAWYYEE